MYGTQGWIGKLKWYRNRLRCMSLPEVSQRILSHLFLSLQALGWFTAKTVPAPDRGAPAASWLGKAPQVDAAAYRAAADRILAGKLDIFALRDLPVGHPPEWNREPRSGKAVPLRFGRLLDYRDAELVGDIKYLWEPNRHLHLVTLAQAYRLTGDEQYLQGIRLQLESWFEQCPYPMGGQWASPLEAGIRLINWSLVWNLVGGSDSSLFRDAPGRKFLDSWLASIYRHGHFIRHGFSRYSSANNHLIGEAAGLFVATCTWPYWREFTELAAARLPGAVAGGRRTDSS